MNGEGEPNSSPSTFKDTARGRNSTQGVSGKVIVTYIFLDSRLSSRFLFALVLESRIDENLVFWYLLPRPLFQVSSSGNVESDGLSLEQPATAQLSHPLPWKVVARIPELNPSGQHWDKASTSHAQPGTRFHGTDVAQRTRERAICLHYWSNADSILPAGA